MSMRKRLLSCACAFAMIAGTAAFIPQGAELAGSVVKVCAETYGDYEYSVLGDGTVEITK